MITKIVIGSGAVVEGRRAVGWGSVDASGIVVPPDVNHVLRRHRDAFGVDLQRLVHEDMAQNFSAYPNIWGLTKPDTNIDHRRVPNLRVFFRRRKTELKISNAAADYQPGDIITVTLPGNLAHIALVTQHLNAEGSQPLCIHNIGQGAKMEDILFAFPQTGHYRFRV